jgi:hypothetical protein
MIEGENTILPVLTFDAGTDWNTLAELAETHLDRRGLTRLVSALEDRVKTIAIERHYVDKDYRDTFSNFHSKRFSTPDSRCLRLHFFSEPVTREQLKDAKVNSCYQGYSVIRPTKPNCIGRTLLHPASAGPASACAALCKERVSILGTELEIVGFPFISQDADVTVCAQSAVWMLLRYFSNRYALYAETYPFQVGNLTKDYSLGRVHPTSGLYVWQMSEALRRVGLAPIIYTRHSFPKEFDHLLYTYIESGIPVLAGLPEHVVVAFGHRSDYSTTVASKPIIYTSEYNNAFVINDDNGVPYQLLHKNKTSAPSGSHTSKYDFSKIEDFIVPLPEKVFLAAEGFQTVVEALLTGSEFGISALSPTLQSAPLVLRMFLTTGKSFKKKLAVRGMGHGNVAEVYRNLPLPHFIWVCEISDPGVFVKHEIKGEIIWDATRNAHEPNGWIALHYPEILVVDAGSAFNGPQELKKLPLQNSKDYPVYRNNLQDI